MSISFALFGMLTFLVGIFFGFWIMEQNLLSKAKKILQVAPSTKFVAGKIMIGICTALNTLFDGKLKREVEIAIMENSILKNKESNENLILFEKNYRGGQKL